MAQEDEEEDLVFNVEEVQKIVRDNIELCLGGNAYSHSRTPQWIAVITDKTMARLHKLNKPFKYIDDGSETLFSKQRDDNFHSPSSIVTLVRIIVTQKNGSGLHTAAAYYWDTATDSTCTVRWENKFMYCIVNVWGLALQL